MSSLVETAWSSAIGETLSEPATAAVFASSGRFADTFDHRGVADVGDGEAVAERVARAGDGVAVGVDLQRGGQRHRAEGGDGRHRPARLVPKVARTETISGSARPRCARLHRTICVAGDDETAGDADERAVARLIKGCGHPHRHARDEPGGRAVDAEGEAAIGGERKDD